jgi:hypothetical protein
MFHAPVYHNEVEQSAASPEMFGLAVHPFTKLCSCAIRFVVSISGSPISALAGAGTVQADCIKHLEQFSARPSDGWLRSLANRFYLS